MYAVPAQLSAPSVTPGRRAEPHVWSRAGPNPRLGLEFGGLGFRVQGSGFGAHLGLEADNDRAAGVRGHEGALALGEWGSALGVVDLILRQDEQRAQEPEGRGGVRAGLRKAAGRQRRGLLSQSLERLLV